MLRFGDFAFDPEARGLARRGERVHLSPKCFDLLGVLLAERPRAVAKSLIFERLWPKTFVSESSLTKLVAELRSALGDDARRPRFVRTLHRVGYVFCADAVEARDRGAGHRGVPRCSLLWENREFGLAEGENVIGRSREAEVRIRSPEVSRRHARILVSADRITLEDLGSRNGTRVGGVKVEGLATLENGDRIGVGPCVLVLVSGSGQDSSTRSGHEGPRPPKSRGPRARPTR